MYRALKDAQSDINTALLKLVDDITGVTESRTSVLPKEKSVSSDQLQDITNTIGFLHQKQNAQFELLVEELRSIKQNMDNMLKLIISKESIVTDTIIPTLQPTSHESDFKRVFINAAEDIPQEDTHNSHVSDQEVEEQVEQQVEEQEVEEQEVEQEEQEQEVEEQEVEEEQEQEQEEQEQEQEEQEQEVQPPQPPQPPQAQVAPVEEEVEVEEWTYKGRLFFKDSENIVYVNNAGEIGDAMGQYDPVKNIVKKLPSN